MIESDEEGESEEKSSDEKEALTKNGYKSLGGEEHIYHPLGSYVSLYICEPAYVHLVHHLQVEVLVERRVILAL